MLLSWRVDTHHRCSPSGRKKSVTNEEVSLRCPTEMTPCVFYNTTAVTCILLRQQSTMFSKYEQCSYQVSPCIRQQRSNMFHKHFFLRPIVTCMRQRPCGKHSNIFYFCSPSASRASGGDTAAVVDPVSEVRGGRRFLHFPRHGVQVPEPLRVRRADGRGPQVGCRAGDSCAAKRIEEKSKLPFASRRTAVRGENCQSPPPPVWVVEMELVLVVTRMLTATKAVEVEVEGV